MGRVIAIANQKGGVGKTTTAINLAASLAAEEQRTLIVDCDSQGNTTSGLGFSKDPARRTLYHSLILNEPIERVVLSTQVDGLDIIPADKNLVGAGVELVSLEGREYFLRKAIESIKTNYRFVILDCPPALDLVTLNALVASDSVLIPIQCEYLALEGVSELLDTLMRIRRTLNPDLAVEGILLTMYDERTTLSHQVASDLRSFFGAQVFSTVIPRNVRLAEAPSHGKPIIFYDIHSRGAESYVQLAKEVIANDQKRAGTGPECPDPATLPSVTAGEPQQIDIDLIDPSPYQPRTRFREEPLEELARSIRSSGIIQPLILRTQGSRFQLIAGERRWRAAQRAGLLRVPAIVREVPEEMALEITLVENIQREDLNPIEQARAFERLTVDFHLTQENVAERTGKDRTTVANAVRLLRLEKPLQDLIEDGRLTAGHGRALLAIPDAGLRQSLAQRAARGGLTVRQIERLGARKSARSAPPHPPTLDANTRAALEELQRHLGTRATLRPRTKTRPGQLILEYYDDAQLVGLYDRLMK